MATAALTACCSFEGGFEEGSVGVVEGGSVEEEGSVGGGSNEVLVLESTKAAAAAADTSTEDLPLGT